MTPPLPRSGRRSTILRILTGPSVVRQIELWTLSGYKSAAETSGKTELAFFALWAQGWRVPFFFAHTLKKGKIMHKHYFLMMVTVLFALLFTSTSPYVPSFGGKINIKNDSAHNLYIIFKAVSDAENTERMFCIEKGEQIPIIHRFSGEYQKNLANPSNYYTAIALYDFDSGLLLNTLTVNSGTFVLKTGSVNANNALFEFTINDDSWGGTP
jgi:hypothetical protein